MKLGKNQIGVLKSIVQHGGFHESCGWIWSTRSATERICESLISKGFVYRASSKNKFWPNYQATTKGTEFIRGI